ncbi:hypothetical protein U9M48_015690 [Paspalum notatum var. saurae]|uniref:Uncharacterized protein n=1 Tax=Paspalum notatum var. saurae TaxID=547442 RepID=A0AAQ3T4Y3_PASNO
MAQAGRYGGGEAIDQPFALSEPNHDPELLERVLAWSSHSATEWKAVGAIDVAYNPLWLPVNGLLQTCRLQSVLLCWNNSIGLCICSCRFLYISCDAEISGLVYCAPVHR